MSLPPSRPERLPSPMRPVSFCPVTRFVPAQIRALAGLGRALCAHGVSAPLMITSSEPCQFVHHRRLYTSYRGLGIAHCNLSPIRPVGPCSLAPAANVMRASFFSRPSSVRLLPCGGRPLRPAVRRVLSLRLDMVQSPGRSVVFPPHRSWRCDAAHAQRARPIRFPYSTHVPCRCATAARFPFTI